MVKSVSLIWISNGGCDTQFYIFAWFKRNRDNIRVASRSWEIDRSKRIKYCHTEDLVRMIATECTQLEASKIQNEMFTVYERSVTKFKFPTLFFINKQLPLYFLYFLFQISKTLINSYVSVTNERIQNSFRRKGVIFWKFRYHKEKMSIFR